MDKWLFRLKGTVIDILRGEVNVLYQIPKCWAFYGFKYRAVRALDEIIGILGSEKCTYNQKEESVKNFESISQDVENYIGK